jgi:PAS domain S-box-containing protein
MVLVTDDGAADVEAPPRVLFANELFCSTLGYAPDELVGSPIATVYGERTDTRELARRRARMRSGETVTGGSLLYTKQGDVLWTEWTVQRIDDPGNGWVHLHRGRVVDRRRPADGDLRSLIVAIENASDAVLIYELFEHDSEAHVRYANRAAELQSGYTRKELERATRVGPRTDLGSLEAITESMKRGESVRSRQYFYRKDGSAYWAECNLRPLLEPTPGCWRWISMERDITEAVEREGMLTAERDAYSTLAAAAEVFLDSHERERLEYAYTHARQRLIASARRDVVEVLDSMYESALRRLQLYAESVDRRNATADAQAAQADIMALLAHDIRGPLNTVIGFAELTAESAEGSSEVQEYTRLIIAAANRVVELTNEVIVAAQLERNEYKPAIERFDLISLLESVVRLLPGGDRVKFDFGDERIELESDLAGVRHIVGNLAGNALKYSDISAPVLITVRCDDDIVSVEFRDRGIGIPADEVHAVFERFARASNAKQSKIRGTGLGLYFVKQLVERNNGTIVLDSRQNEGTVVTVRLPLKTLSAVDLPVVVSIESDSEDRSVIATELRLSGYVVRVVQTPTAAEAIFRQERVGLVLVDIDAFDQAALSGLWSDCERRCIHVIATGADCESAERFQLRKPFTATDLVQKVGAIIPVIVA